MTDDLLPQLAARLRATPAELAGLVVLLVGVITLAVVTTRPTGPPAAPAPTAGSVLDPVPVGGEVTVHVAGAVAAPGVLTLPPGSRVADAVLAAGGLTPDADAAALNLARLLTDGEQILVPLVGSAPAAGGATAAGGAVEGDGRLDLNAASASELEELPGVGPVLAGRIVAFREEHGPFTEVGQLREVSGIGERTFQSLADLVVVR